MHMNPSMIAAASSSSSSSPSPSPPPPPPPCYASLVPPASHVEEGRRYSAGERRERIERYRSKRQRRNFRKKITYACRKTLAENRRRIKGRFAHNTPGGGNEPQHLPAEAEAEAEADQIPSSSKQELGHDVDDGGSSAAVPEWWPAMEEALAREEEEIMLATSYLGVNLLY